MLPKAFEDKFKNLLGKEYEEFKNAINDKRYRGLRINTNKVTDIKKFKFLVDNLEKIPFVENGFYYNKDLKIGLHPFHYAGMYYIQEPSAMMVIENADIKPGNVVLDLCAAPGGKSTQIVQYLKGEGLLISNELVSKRARILEENVERMGISNCIILNENSENLSKVFQNYFDKIIVDAPCSGEGMFRKQSDAKKLWSEKVVYNCASIQKELIRDAYTMLKEDGILIYSTCTFSPEEDEQIISDFINEYPDMEILPTIKGSGIKDGKPEWSTGNKDLKLTSRYWFHHFKGEGHFIAKLKKTSGTNKRSKRKQSKSLVKANNIELKVFNDFISSTLKNINILYKIYSFNGHLYTLETNEEIPNLDKLRIKRYGLYLGECKKNRFEPSHALAMYLNKDQVINVVNFDSESSEVRQYLNNHTLQYESNIKGYALVTVDNISLGWGKLVDNYLKNHFPKNYNMTRPRI